MPFDSYKIHCLRLTCVIVEFVLGSVTTLLDLVGFEQKYAAQAAP